MLNVWIVLRFLQPCDFLEVYHETDGTPEMDAQPDDLIPFSGSEP
jgi:hypothetical protein